MTTQAMAPGVHVIEVSPGSPITGVGTTTTAFVGTALTGRADEPVLLQKWDDFVAEFGDGGPTPSPTRGFARAVNGFFLNGGTTAYVLRVSQGVASWKELQTKSSQPALVVTAAAEGPAGDNLRVEVRHDSLLSERLGTPGAGLLIVSTPTAITTVSQDRLTLTVASTAGLASGTQVQLKSQDGNSQLATIAAVEGPGSLRLIAALDANHDVTGGTLRPRRVPAGTRQLTLDRPAGLRLEQGVPPGALVRVLAQGVDEIHVVQRAGTGSVTLERPLADALDVTGNPAPKLTTLEFTLRITGAGPQPEVWERLSTTPGHPRDWRTTVLSANVRLAAPRPPPTDSDPRPAVSAAAPLTGGQVDDPDATWITLRNDVTTALRPLERLDDVALLCVPGLTDTVAQQAVVAHCEAAGDRFAILDPPVGADVAAVRTHREALLSPLGFGALYYPNILVRNVASGQDDLQPPSGHLAGVFARSDATTGVHKAPANEGIRGGVGLERRLIDAEQALLNEESVNALRIFRGGPPLVWGARTLASDRSMQYVNVRRLMLFLEGSIRAGIGWAVFRPNNQALWKTLDRSISAFLTRVWRDGALFGASPAEAFRIQIDELNNPPENRRNGILTIDCRVSPTFPAEHILLRIGLLVEDES